MSRIVLAAACLAATIAPASVQAQGALKPVDARIVNSRSEPVPVTVLSTPAPPGEGSREIYQKSFRVEFSGPADRCAAAETLPAGKRLVLLHLGGFALIGAPAALAAVGVTSAASTELAGNGSATVTLHGYLVDKRCSARRSVAGLSAALRNRR